ncbi:hypothetical protein PHMEG_0008086 [Phytophthora megakarya]|uniref:Uncharacterized protein n=1 Tax=Phytophthora megakarya TaxID=4795 RepID=A0A225WLL7_9STRA|nr:hypothetical protein PHMEG_0008086 [Phytophthora megakarya]
MQYDSTQLLDGAHCTWDNGYGLVSELAPGERYVQTFLILRESFLRLRTLKGIEFDADAASSVWVVMVGHQTKILRSNDGKKRLIVCTVRSNYLDKWNRVQITKSKKRAKSMERGSWKLVAAIDPVSGGKMEEKHNQSQRKIPRDSHPVPHRCPCHDFHPIHDTSYSRIPSQ